MARPSIYTKELEERMLEEIASGRSVISMCREEKWTPNADTWYHVAAERTGGKVHLYVDGTMLGSGTSNSDNVYANTAKFEVGSCENTGALTFNGHIDEPRFVLGVGLYGGSNFTPETAAYTDPATANPFIVTGTITAVNDSPTNGDA